MQQGLKQKLAKFHNCPIETTHSACSLGIIVDEHLTFSDQISSLSKSCYSHMRALRCIRQYLDFKTSSTMPHLVHSKLDYCYSLHTVFQSTKFSYKIDFNKSKTLSLALLSNLPAFHTSLL